MTPTYAWHCHVCSHVNDVNVSACIKCGNSSVMSGTEVENAKRALAGLPPDPFVKEIEVAKELTAELKKLRWWQLVLVVPSALVSIGGMIVFKAAILPMTMLYGVLAALGGGFVCVVVASLPVNGKGQQSG